MSGSSSIRNGLMLDLNSKSKIFSTDPEQKKPKLKPDIPHFYCSQRVSKLLAKEKEYNDIEFSFRKKQFKTKPPIIEHQNIVLEDQFRKGTSSSTLLQKMLRKYDL